MLIETVMIFAIPEPLKVEHEAALLLSEYLERVITRPGSGMQSLDGIGLPQASLNRKLRK